LATAARALSRARVGRFASWQVGNWAPATLPTRQLANPPTRSSLPAIAFRFRTAPHRASVIGAGSFGTAIAILLERADIRTTLLCRTAEQAETIAAARENERYLPGVELPERLKIRVLGGVEEQFSRSDLIFVAVPSSGLREALAELVRQGISPRAGLVSLAKGLVPPDGTPPSVALEAEFGPERVACVGGPAHAREMVEGGAGLVCASHSPALAERVSETFRAARVVCEASSDPIGVELAGSAKNAAALAAGATEQQGLNAAGMAAADIFTEVLALAELGGARARTFVGRAGVGDLVATALAQTSRNRSAGELLAAGVPAAEIPGRLGQAVESLETVPLLARAIERAGIQAPIVSALARLIDGSLPLGDWVALVRVSQPEPERRLGRIASWWRRVRARFRRAANRPAALEPGPPERLPAAGRSRS
jgi:glycerol-3-phosphate dehydrogenase (NAD(P)+)